jgi:tetratricopeptide (TPR) repeat protein
VILRDIFKKQINEGGNLASHTAAGAPTVGWTGVPGTYSAGKIDSANRAAMQPAVKQLLVDINNLFTRQYGRPIWSPELIEKEVETFTIAFENMKPSACDIHFVWEKTDVSFSVTMDVKEKLKAQIEAGMNADKKPYYQAAQFYNEYEIDLPKALTNVDKAIEANPTAYWMMLYKAKIQEKMGDFNGALITSQQSMEAAKKADNPDYIKSNTDFQKAVKAKMK